MRRIRWSSTRRPWSRRLRVQIPDARQHITSRYGWSFHRAQWERWRAKTEDGSAAPEVEIRAQTPRSRGRARPRESSRAGSSRSTDCRCLGVDRRTSRDAGGVGHPESRGPHRAACRWCGRVTLAGMLWQVDLRGDSRESRPRSRNSIDDLPRAVRTSGLRPRSPPRAVPRNRRAALRVPTRDVRDARHGT